MKTSQRVAGLVVVIGVLVTGSVCYTSGAKAAEDDLVGQGTWPSVSVNIRSRNGMLVAEGMTTGGVGRHANRVLWRTPLGHAGQGTSIQRGGSTTFVQTGSGNQFVIDNATGRTIVMRENQVWRRSTGEMVDVPGPYRPVRPEVAAPPLAPGASPGAVPASESASPGVSESAAPGNAYAGDAHTGPAAPAHRGDEMSGLSNYQLALRDLMTANNVLITRLDRERELAAVESSELPSARRAVEQARQSVAAAQQRVHRLAPRTEEESPSTSDEPARANPPARPTLTPQQYANHRAAQQRALDLSAAMNRKAMLLEAQLELGHITPEEYAHEQKTVAAYQREVDRANLRAAEILLEANQPEELSPRDRQRFEQAERQVIAVQERILTLERQLREVEQKESNGQADEEDVERAQTKLTEAYQQLMAASNTLTEARETTTQPVK